MKKLLSSFVFLLMWHCSFAQATNFTIEQIDSVVKKIDLSCISGGIVDYEIHPKGKKKTTIGGGADWFYTDSSGKKLVRVMREISLSSESMDTYYFYQDSLIFLKTSNGTYVNGEKKINSQGKYYFQNSQIIFKDDDIKFVFKPTGYLSTARQFFDANQIWRKGQ